MTTLVAAIQESLLILESSNDGWKKTHKLSKGTSPQYIAFDTSLPNVNCFIVSFLIIQLICT
jgi:hypothetical protein